MSAIPHVFGQQLWNYNISMAIYWITPLIPGVIFGIWKGFIVIGETCIK